MEKERKRNTRGRDLIDKLKTTKTEPKKVTNTWEPFGMMIAMVFRK